MPGTGPAASPSFPVDATPPDLTKVGIFAFGGVGIAGVTSEGERAFRQVLTAPDAAQQFAEMFAKARNAGKCYCLVALRELNPDQFSRLAAVAEAMDGRQNVRVMNGCIMSTDRLVEVVRGIRSGYFARYVKRP